MTAFPAILITALAISQVAPPSQQERQTGGCPISSIYFDTDSAELTSHALQVLQHLLPMLQQNVVEGWWINLFGSADIRGSAAYNLRLSRRRAEAVQRFLLAQGFDHGHLRLFAGGESRVLVENVPENAPGEAHAENRNVNISIEAPIEIYRRANPPGGPVC